MAHTNCDDTAEQVQVAAAGVVEQPLHVPLGDEQGCLVVRLVAGGQMGLPYLGHLLVAGTLRGGWSFRSQQQSYNLASISTPTHRVWLRFVGAGRHSREGRTMAISRRLRQQKGH